MVNRILDIAVLASISVFVAFGGAPVLAQSPNLSEVSARFIIDAEPPRPSGRISAPADVIQQQAGGDSLFDVAIFIEKQLRDAGHDDLGWFYVHPENVQAPGFAVVLKAQAVTDDSVKPSFWQKVAPFFVGSAPAVHRVIAIYFAAPPFARSLQHPVAEELRDWQARGSSTPFEKLQEDGAATTHRLTALVYLFQESPSSGELTFLEDADASIHLKAANLDALFGRVGTDQ
jgi:hypothetical protein